MRTPDRQTVQALRKPQAPHVAETGKARVPAGHKEEKEAEVINTRGSLFSGMIVRTINNNAL